MTTVIRTWADSDFYIDSSDGADLLEQFMKLQRIAKLVRSGSDASTVDTNGDKLQDILQGVSLGDLTTRHKWRVLYDNLNDRFLIQRNSGTDASKVWVEQARLDASGNLTVTGSMSTDSLTTTAGGVTLGGDLNVNDFYIRNADDIQTQTIRVQGQSTFQNNHGLGLVYIATKSAAITTPVVDFELSHYAKYVIELEQVRPVSDAVSLLMQVSTNGGASFIAAGYATAGSIGSNFPVLAAVGTSGATAWNVIGDGVTTQDNGLASMINGTVKINARGSALLQCRARSSVDWFESNGLFSITSDIGMFLSPGAQINAIRFRYSSGNMMQGTFRLYGLRDS